AGWSSWASASASRRNQARVWSLGYRLTRRETRRLSRVSLAVNSTRSREAATIVSRRKRFPSADSTRSKIVRGGGVLVTRRAYASATIGTGRVPRRRSYRPRWPQRLGLHQRRACWAVSSAKYTAQSGLA